MPANDGRQNGLAGTVSRHRVAAAFLAAGATLVIAIAFCEFLGWPFLAHPAERWLSARLQRTVSFEDGGRTSVRLHLLGGISVTAGKIRIDNASWSRLGPMLEATDATVKLRYRDLFALRTGKPLRIETLLADTLSVAVERRADGSASWQFGAPKPKDPGAKNPLDGLAFGHIAVRDGKAVVNDAVMRVDADSTFSFTEDASPSGDGTTSGVTAQAKGHYGGLPLTATLRTGSALSALTAAPGTSVLPTQLRLQIGHARVNFDGQVNDVLGGFGLQGRYDVSGASLAAVGEPFHVTLPTTGPFDMQGSLQRSGTRYTTVVDRATIGRSRLAGDFTFDMPPGAVPKLTGHLRGVALWLQDLGPSVGVPVSSSASSAATSPSAVKATSAPRDGKRAVPGQDGALPKRALPDREFDLPSLRAMNADVEIALDKLESGSPRVQAVQPLKAHLVLQDGVLNIGDLDATLAQGRIRGSIQLDGRQPVALWNTKLSLNGLLLEKWILQPRDNGAAPYATGRLGGQIDLHGKGRSTAQLLASADGSAVLHWTQGTVSHLIVEAAGIDLAQALGVAVRGDAPLPVTCGAAALTVKGGTVKPDVMLVDTADSTIWVDGTMSLASEAMDLTAHVGPKDVSPLSLRTPVHLQGTLLDPKVTLEKGPLLKRLIPAALLATINPLLAILPLIDTGDDETKKALTTCQSVAGRKVAGRG